MLLSLSKLSSKSHFCTVTIDQNMFVWSEWNAGKYVRSTCRSLWRLLQSCHGETVINEALWEKKRWLWLRGWGCFRKASPHWLCGCWMPLPGFFLGGGGVAAPPCLRLITLQSASTLPAWGLLSANGNLCFSRVFFFWSKGWSIFLDLLTLSVAVFPFSWACITQKGQREQVSAGPENPELGAGVLHSSTEVNLSSVQSDPPFRRH